MNKTKGKGSPKANLPVSKNVNDYSDVVAHNIEKLLKMKNLSSRDLAQLTGLSEPAMSKYKKGTQFPPIHFFLQIKQLYDISIDDFLTKEIAEKDMQKPDTVNIFQEEELKLYRKFCGTYLLYYLKTSSAKGNDQYAPCDSLIYGVLKISEDNSVQDNPSFTCRAILGIKDREYATNLKSTVEKFESDNEFDRFIASDEDDQLFRKTYYGNFEFTAEHAYITIAHNRTDKAMIILHRVNTKKNAYIGGIGTINGISQGREGMPTVQYIALTRYPISLSEEEIHHNLLLDHPTYKADEKAKSLIALFKKIYIGPEDETSLHTELEKELIIRVNLEHYVKQSLEKNMFRCAKISNQDDETWYKLLKEVSIMD